LAGIEAPNLFSSDEVWLVAILSDLGIQRCHDIPMFSTCYSGCQQKTMMFRREGDRLQALTNCSDRQRQA
jgi:hypothetical protein